MLGLNRCELSQCHFTFVGERRFTSLNWDDRTGTIKGSRDFASCSGHSLTSKRDEMSFRLYIFLLILVAFFIFARNGGRTPQLQVGSRVRYENKAKGVYETRRHVFGFGRTSYAYVLSGAYRTGPGSFVVVGLSSRYVENTKPRSKGHEEPIFGKHKFGCFWHKQDGTTLVGKAKQLSVDWNYGHLYSTSVVHCKFDEEQLTQTGGKLRFSESMDQQDPETMVVLEEKPGDFKESDFPGGEGFETKYDKLYCGSSLFGDINPNRLSEWIAYHAMLFGPRSHFVLHDSGGLKSEANRRVLQPWVRAGLVTVQDFTEQEKFNGYYHNQFMLVNDCFFRYKYAANWTFFFDVDEYVNVPPPATLDSVLAQLGKNYTQIMFEQNLMADNVCLRDEEDEDRSNEWAIERFVFKKLHDGPRQDRKYVLKGGLADSAGIHLSQHIHGAQLYSGSELSYYHYHNTINKYDSTCTTFVKPENKLEALMIKSGNYSYDGSMAALAAQAKAYQKKTIGGDPAPRQRKGWAIEPL